MREVRVNQFFDFLFPGDTQRGFPCFTSCEINIENHLSKYEINKLQSLIHISYSEKNKNNFEVNDLVKHIEKLDRNFFEKVLSVLLEAYFSNEKVIYILKSGELYLFPNHRKLDDLNYDLLESVLEITPRN
jgi:hypothetical protein